MFGKLLSLFQQGPESDHPLGSDQNVEALLRDIPQGDPARVLLDVDQWLGGMDGHVLDIGPLAALQATVRLDQFARAAAEQLLFRYLRSGQREYLSEVIWSTLDEHARHLFHCYVIGLRVLGPQIKDVTDRQRLARCAARALRAWAFRKKLLRFRYRPPTPDVWREAHELLQLVTPWGLLLENQVIYRDEADTSPLVEYLIGVYLELAPLGNLVQPQLEVVEGYLRHCDALSLGEVRRANCSHAIDLAGGRGPRRVDADEPDPARSLRYLSIAALRPSLMKLALEFKRGQTLPAWMTALTFPSDQVGAALLTLVMHWGPAPPQRATGRVDQAAGLRAVFGFLQARRMLACSHFARMGYSLRYDVADINRLFEENRFGKLSTEQLAQVAASDDELAQEVVNPLDTLRALETAGDSALMESWSQLDSSPTGLGATVPTLLPRHRIGALVAVRYVDGLEWRLGLIRRLGRDSANRPCVGIQTLDWNAVCAQARPATPGSIWNEVADGGHSWADAIVLGTESNRLVLPAGAYAPDLEADVRGEDISWKIRLVSLIERGTDFDLIEIQRLL